MCRFFTKLILGKVPQNYSLESNWRAGFANFKQEKYKSTKKWTKWLVQFWREIWRNFSKSKKTWIFYRNLRISKYYKQNFKQFWAIWRSKIGICEKCLKILKKFVIFEFLREILCKSDLPKFCEFDKFLGCSTQICPSLRVFIFKQWNIAISCFGKKSTFLNPQMKIQNFTMVRILAGYIKICAWLRRFLQGQREQHLRFLKQWEGFCWITLQSL